MAMTKAIPMRIVLRFLALNDLRHGSHGRVQVVRAKKPRTCPPMQRVTTKGSLEQRSI